MNPFIAVLIGLIVGIPLNLWQAFVASKLYNWYLLPVSHYPVNIMLWFGIILIWDCLSARTTNIPAKNISTELLFTKAVEYAGIYGLLLFVGYVAKLVLGVR